MATATTTRTHARSSREQSIQDSLKARRVERTRIRKERARVARNRRIARMVIRFLYWLELQPRRIAEASTSFFVCAIILLLLGAIFFGAIGVLEMAMSFCVEHYTAW